MGKDDAGKLPTGAERLRQLIGEEAAAKPKTRKAKVKGEGSLAKQPDASLSGAANGNAWRVLSQEKEMFYTQLSLDVSARRSRSSRTRRRRRKALRRSEQKLEEDAIRFDTFLKENDKRAHDAVKEAEAATKKKNDKVQEIKRLNQQLQAVSSEMSKQRGGARRLLEVSGVPRRIDAGGTLRGEQKIEERAQEARRQRRISKRVEAEERGGGETSTTRISGGAGGGIFT